MKGIAHFITGVALATMFPSVVQHASEGGLLPVLAGIGGILPDTLDFKFARYWERYDVEIDPGPDVDPEAIADALLAAMQQAYDRQVSQNVMLHTIQLGTDRWRRYSVHLEPEQRRLEVRVGPVVNTSQMPIQPPDDLMERVAVRTVPFDFSHSYQSTYHVDIFSGPSFRFDAEGEGVAIRFLDWHHRWTHSLPLALALGGATGLLAWLFVPGQIALWAGFMVALGYAAHVLEDQLGHMGCNLFWPFTKKRQAGLGLLHASDAAPNFLVVWSSLVLILFNLDRFSAMPRLPAVPYLLLALGGPWLWFVLRSLRRSSPLTGELAAQADVLAEAQDERVV